MMENNQKDPFVTQVLNFVQDKGFDNIKAISDNFDDPKPFRTTSGNLEFVPDITATKNGGKHYFEVAMKEGETQQVISKWKLLSKMAEVKNGSLYLFVPRGHKSFTRKVVEDYDIEAKVMML